MLCMIICRKILKDKLNKKQSSPNAISHKDLNTLLNKAKKETISIDTSDNNLINESHEFNELLKDWTYKSQKLLLMLNKKDQVLSKNRNPKSLIAFGAMGAHISMALQALKASEFEK